MKKHAFAVLMALYLMLSINIPLETQAQKQYTLHLQGFTWTHAEITALIILADNEAGWNPGYINATLRAVNQWNEVLTEFAANYSDFAYLEMISITPIISNETSIEAGIYIFWTEDSAGDSPTELGIAKTVTTGHSTIVNCTITLSTKNQHGIPISEADMQNIVLHEMGHALGLGHSNHTEDLMYPTLYLDGKIRPISNLNAYGVATVFQWLPNPSQLHPVSRWLRQLTITLPEEMEYQHLTIPEDSLLPQTVQNPIIETVQTIVEHFITLMLSPERLIPITGIIIATTIIILLTLKRKKTAEQRSEKPNQEPKV